MSWNQNFTGKENLFFNFWRLLEKFVKPGIVKNPNSCTCMKMGSVEMRHEDWTKSNFTKSRMLHWKNQEKRNCEDEMISRKWAIYQNFYPLAIRRNSWITRYSVDTHVGGKLKNNFGSWSIRVLVDVPSTEILKKLPQETGELSRKRKWRSKRDEEKDAISGALTIWSTSFMHAPSRCRKWCELLFN